MISWSYRLCVQCSAYDGSIVGAFRHLPTADRVLNWRTPMIFLVIITNKWRQYVESDEHGKKRI